MGSLELIVGGIGLMGLINKKKRLLLVYNIFSVIFFIITTVLCILAFILSN